MRLRGVLSDVLAEVHVPHGQREVVIDLPGECLVDTVEIGNPPTAVSDCSRIRSACTKNGIIASF